MCVTVFGGDPIGNEESGVRVPINGINIFIKGQQTGLVFLLHEVAMRSTTWKWSGTRTQNHAGAPFSLSLASYAMTCEK